jgi:hypothetical protein
MRFHKFVLTGLTAVAGLGIATSALADGRNPGSLLLFPEFDNRDGTVTVLTVTNTATDVGDVQVEYVYIGVEGQDGYEIDCEEFNRTEIFTDNDTLTLITNFHNPQQEQGFVYAFARAGVDNPIAHNWLIGNVMTVAGLEAFEYSVNPVAYEAPMGGGVDLNGNGLRDLDGVEYETSPDEILVPRFLGQGGMFNSELILIGLTGGARFETTVDFLIYNDNEEVFSSEYSFKCWERVELLQISGIFDNNFLQNFTNHDPQELLGAPDIETGWFRMDGALASSTTTSLSNPAVYGVLVERIGNRGAADLPFETGMNANGKLFARSNNGQF